MSTNLNSSSSRLALLCLGALLAFSSACNRGISEPGAPNSPTARRYPFKGKVISVDKNAATANIDNEPIPGFMDPMVMPYSIKPPAMLAQLQPGDSITADVVVQPDNAQPDNKYWLENVKVTGHSKVPDGEPPRPVTVWQGVTKEESHT
jgi:Cu/Ag efflux protein CusF